MQTSSRECRTGMKWMSGVVAPLFTLVIFIQHFITLLMFVLNFVLFSNLFTSDFHEGRQYFITLLMLC